MPGTGAERRLHQQAVHGAALTQRIASSRLGVHNHRGEVTVHTPEQSVRIDRKDQVSTGSRIPLRTHFERVTSSNGKKTSLDSNKPNEGNERTVQRAR